MKPTLTRNMNYWKPKAISFGVIPFLFFIALSSCKKELGELKPVSYAEFEKFIQATGYVTDAEEYGWSIVQIDVYNYKKVDNATWKVPNGVDSVFLSNLPVTQVSYNDAKAYCEWAEKRLPTYEEYWEIIKKDTRVVVSENKLPISEVDKVNVLGNVWDITDSEKTESVRLAGGSLFCSKKTCHGTTKERAFFVDKETGNIHIGFSVLDI